MLVRIFPQHHQPVNRLRSARLLLCRTKTKDDMRILDFYREFPDEQSCRAHFRAYREKVGVTCRKCGGTEHYWKLKREQWECKHCAHRTTLKSGTVMQNSKLTFRYRFVAMHLLTSTKKSFSAKEVQRQLGHKRYEPVWAMLHKIRSVMGLRDDEYGLSGAIELDEGFFETVTPDRDVEQPLKRGRGSERQTTVLVLAESEKVEDADSGKRHSTDRKLGFVKMKVIHSLKMKEVTLKVNHSVTKGSTIISDGSSSYNELGKSHEHHPQVVAPKESSKLLPWVHKTISNAKRLLLDVHHRIDDDFLENYLNEFCYKLNRRYFDDPFDRVMIAAVSYRWNYLGERYG